MCSEVMAMVVSVTRLREGGRTVDWSQSTDRLLRAPLRTRERERTPLYGRAIDRPFLALLVRASEAVVVAAAAVTACAVTSSCAGSASRCDLIAHQVVLVLCAPMSRVAHDSSRRWRTTDVFENALE